MGSCKRRFACAAVVLITAAASISGCTAPKSRPQPAVAASSSAAPAAPARNPVEHVVVIFDENISFDHYFGTYPKAANSDGTPFHAAPRTPKVNGLTRKLLKDNPNAYNP